MSFWIGILLVLLPLIALSNSIPLVTDVVAQQRDDGSGMVDVHFALYDADGDLMAVRLFLSEDGGETYPIECLSTTPPPGTYFQSGQNRYLAWNAIVDFPGHQGDYIVRVFADDGQGVDPGSFALLPPGTFIMGAPVEEPYSGSDERPQHSVTLTHAFYLQVTEVTNQQYRDLAQWAYNQYPPLVTFSNGALRDALDGSTKALLAMSASGCEISFSDGVFTVDAGKEDHPVKHVTWYGSAAYCDWLSLQAIPALPRAYDHSTWQCNGNSPYTAQGYRLPTEAEWEYACRAGTQTPFNTGECLDAGTEANYKGNSPYPDCPSGPYVGWTVSVGTYPSNAWGLYDMHGNLHEWCNDWSDYPNYDYYENSPSHDPVGPTSGSLRVNRGGSWLSYAIDCRSAARSAVAPYSTYDVLGFRPARRAD